MEEQLGGGLFEEYYSICPVVIYCTTCGEKKKEVVSRYYI